MSSPVIRSASSAPRRNVSDARSTSTSASRIGLPASSAISRPSSSRRRLDPGADLAQDPAALVGRQVPRDLEGGDGGLDRLLVLRLGRVERRAGRRRPGRPGWRRRAGRATRPSGRRGRSGAAWRRRRWSCGGSCEVGGTVVPCDAVPPSDARPADQPSRASCDDTPMRPARRACASSRAREVRLARLDPGATHGCDKERRGRRRSSSSSTGWPTCRTGCWAEASAPSSSSSRASTPPARTARSSKVMEAFNPQGCPVTSFKVPEHRGARPRLPLAGPPARARARARSAIFNRSHYEDVLVVRVHDLVPEGGLVEALRPDQRLRADAGRERDDDRQVLPARSTATSSASGSRPATTTRRSAGSSRSATSRSASSGTTTRRPSTTPSRRRRRPGRRGTSSRRTASGSGTWPCRRSSPTRSPTSSRAYPAAGRTCRRTSSSSSAGRVSAAPTCLPPPNSVPKTPRMMSWPSREVDDLAAGPDGRVDRLLARLARRRRGLLLGLALPLRLARRAAFCGRLDRLLLARDLALLLGRRHRVHARPAVVGSTPAARSRLDRRLPRGAPRAAP